MAEQTNPLDQVEQATALDVVIALGAHEVPGELPLIPTRFRISAAFFFAVGWREGDTDEDDGGPSAEPDADDLAAVYAASIGLCWPEPRPWPSLRAQKRDVVEYGEHVLHHLMLSGFSQKDVIEEGRRLALLIRHSIPTVPEVREAEADFTESAEASTGPTAGSASPNTDTPSASTVNP